MNKNKNFPFLAQLCRICVENLGGIIFERENQNKK